MKKGFTYVETIMSMMLLSIMAMAIAQVIAISIQNYHNAALRYRASVGVQGLYEELRSQLLLSPLPTGEDLYTALQITPDDFAAQYNGQDLAFSITINSDYWATAQNLPQSEIDLSLQATAPIFSSIPTYTIVVEAYEKETLMLLFRLVDVAACG